MSTDRSPSILAEIALQFIDQRETVATAALGRFLGVPTCRDALIRLLSQRGVPCEGSLLFRTEVIEPGAEGRPDVVGFDVTTGLRRLIIEGKFWATLTDYQPVGYLKSLPEGGALIVAAPARRFPTLWAELLVRSGDAGLAVTEPITTAELWVARVGSAWMVLLSWTHLLDTLRAALLEEGDTRRVADIDQVDSLCAQEDTEAFLPLASEDLGRPTPLRVYQYIQLVEDVARRGLEMKIFRPAALTTGGTFGQHIRYMAAGDMQCAISFDLLRWARQRLTPLWMEMAVNPGDALRSLEAGPVPQVFYDGSRGRPVVPLRLPLHTEYHALVGCLCEQIREVVRMVDGCELTARVGEAHSRRRPSVAKSLGTD